MLVKQRHYAKLFVAAIVALATVIVLGVNAMAEDTNTATANTLKVSPVRTDISADPGETKTVNITITNPSSADVVVRAIQNDFMAGDEEGTPAIILEEDQYAPKHSLKRFMRPVDNVAVAAGESKTVRVTIAVPTSARAGGYFGALRFAPTSPDDGGQVNMSASVASLILLRVNGEVPEKLELTDFVARQDGKAGSFFTRAEAISAMVRFKNDGDVQLGPFGKLSLKKGDDVVYAMDFNNKDQRDMVLPDSARRWTVPLEGIDGFGKYTMSAVFTYGSKNQTIDATYSFWVVPLWMIVTLSVVLLTVIAAVVGFVLYRRKHPRKVSLGNSQRR